MLIQFRQGIVTRQTPNFLAINGSAVDLLASFNSPTIVTFAQGDTDILFQENLSISQAWAGPFDNIHHFWLYWDINQKTGIRTFGATQLMPVTQATPPANPANDQHWYDTVNFIMNVFSNGSWSPRVRVFAGEVNAGTLVQYNAGSQIGNNTPVRAGFVLFDDTNLPVKKFQQFNQGEFITTESPLASQSSRLQNFRLESSIDTGLASMAIAQFKAVCYTGPGQLGVASSNTPAQPAIGVAAENFSSGDVNSFIQTGYIYNPLWNFGATGANLFVDAFGNLTTTPPSVGSLQVMGYVVDPQTIFIKPQPIIIFG